MQKVLFYNKLNNKLVKMKTNLIKFMNNYNKVINKNIINIK